MILVAVGWRDNERLCSTTSGAVSLKSCRLAATFLPVVVEEEGTMSGVEVEAEEEDDDDEEMDELEASLDGPGEERWWTWKLLVGVSFGWPREPDWEEPDEAEGGHGASSGTTRLSLSMLFGIITPFTGLLERLRV